jgi:glutaredoxin
MRTVTLFGRPDCHLCAEARAALERVRAAHPFALREVDIEADDELFKRYLERIPVVALDGEELFDFFVDERVLAARLGGAGGDRAAGPRDDGTH